MACWRASRMEWRSCWTVITSAAVELSRQALAIARWFVFTTASASCFRPAPRACAGCNGQAERPIGSDHRKTWFYSNCHRYCWSLGQITEHPKRNGARRGSESSCLREHVLSGKCSEVNSSNSHKFSKKLEKFGEVWRSLKKFGEFGEFGEMCLGPAPCFTTFLVSWIIFDTEIFGCPGMYQVYSRYIQWNNPGISNGTDIPSIYLVYCIYT